MRARIRLPLWGKFLSGSIAIAGVVGVATAAGLAIDSNDADSSSTVSPRPPERPPKAGRPQTILLIGSEPGAPKRSRSGGEARMVMLIRLDPQRFQTRMLSLSPSVTTSFARFGKLTIAQAHAAAGAKAVLQMVKELTGLQVNHLVDVDTRGFTQIVNGLGCVYVDVDRPYRLEIATVNAPDGRLSAGYQRLCGATALQYALAGDESQPLGEARQQQLLAAMAPPGGVWRNRKKLVGLFTKYTASDVDDVRTMLQLIGLVIPLQRAPVTTIRFVRKGELGKATAESPGIDRAVGEFLAPQGMAAPPQLGAPRHSRVRHIRLEPSMVRSLGELSGLPKLQPDAIPKGWVVERPRVYKLDGTGDGWPPARERTSYRWTIRGPGRGEYAGIQATAWRNPPMLNNPTSQMTERGRTYELFYDRGRLRTVAWQTSRGSFWVSNTLTEALSNGQMIAMANGMTEVGVKPD